MTSKEGEVADYIMVLADISKRSMTGAQKSQARRIASKLSWFYGFADVLTATNGVTIEQLCTAAIESVPANAEEKEAIEPCLIGPEKCKVCRMIRDDCETIDQQEAQAEQAPFDF